MVDQEQLNRIERKLDELLELAPVLETLGRLLVRSHTAGKALGLNKTTLTQNKKVTKFEEVGHRRVYVEVGEINVVKKRKRR